ncbi:MAG: hypothetical protein RLW62_11205, partial [Gammaproteobacteria bacterium]
LRAVLIGVVAISGIVLLATLGTWRLFRRRGHRAAALPPAVDAHKVAEITRKATRRLEMEEDVRRRLTARHNGDGAAAPAAGRDPLEETHEVLLAETFEDALASGDRGSTEALLGDLIASQPHNVRAKLRLLELYYVDFRRDEFVQLAIELQHAHRDDIDDPAWQRVMRMGREIAPDIAPFSGPLVARSA